VVIGASAGGVAALALLMCGLPADFSAAMLVVLHLSPSAPSALPAILARRTPLAVSQASDGHSLQRGHVYVAPPGHHCLLDDGRVRLSTAPPERHNRPSVDVTLASAARAFGPRAIGVVLTGALCDGTAGLREIKRQGGTTIVQDPADAPYPSMPSHAIAALRPDHVVTVHDLPGLLVDILALARRQ
jgi:two-component system chemotaxis response regulator CheB